MTDLRALFNAGTGNSELTLKTNITPEITIKLADLLVPGQPSSDVVASEHPMLMRLIKPEIIVHTLGIERAYSPFGRPRSGMYSTVLMGLVTSCLVSALVTWAVCKNYF